MQIRELIALAYYAAGLVVLALLLIVGGIL